jgi:hypothetical protein
VPDLTSERDTVEWRVVDPVASHEPVRGPVHRVGGLAPSAPRHEAERVTVDGDASVIAA